MEKYYTPKIEEFHVGFEFESDYVLFQSHPGNSWTKVTLDLDKHDWFWNEYIGDASPLEFRVKYLDREDIESFGFKWFEDNELAWKDNLKLQLHNENRVTIDYISNGNHVRRLVEQIQIKNKSEFKKLLKQLKIC